jgi:transposase-like protein
LTRPKNKSFSPEFKEEAVKMVIETSRPVAVVAKELGVNESTLGERANAQLKTRDVLDKLRCCP